MPVRGEGGQSRHAEGPETVRKNAATNRAQSGARNVEEYRRMCKVKDSHSDKTEQCA